ncbi:MAG TPA: 30S ribosomal protein S8 [Candidatus Paceibacterota bacterium]
MVTDPIGDMLIRIKNAGNAGKKTVSFPYSKLKFEIMKVLFEKKMVGEISKKGKKNIKLIEAVLLYDEFENPKVSGFKRFSKTSRRIYLGAKEIHKVKNGFGWGVYSTVKGIVSNKEARSLKIGGEFLFEIW